MLRVFLFFIGITNSLFLFAQKNQYQFNTIDVKQGLSNNSISTVYKDEIGFMWMGTVSGLNRYDGYNFKVFKHIIGDSTSINDNYINQIVRGPRHTMWVNTPKGWNIYDPRTERFSANVIGFLRSIGISNNNFSTIVPDLTGNFWFIFPGKGIYKFHSATGKSTFYHKNNAQPLLYSNNISAMAFSSKNVLWVTYTEGVLDKINLSNSKLINRNDALQHYSLNQKINYKLFVDSEDDLWVYANGEIEGIYWYKPNTNQFVHIHKNTEKISLNNDIINGIVQDNNGRIWIATDHGGINLIHKATASVNYLYNNEQDERSISENAVNTIYKDNLGTIWLGTFKKGVNYYHEGDVKFPWYQRQPNQKSGLIYNDINCFTEDKKGNLWLGTNGGGLIYFDRKLGTYRNYLHIPGVSNSLSNNIITSLYLDRLGKLWIGTYYGGLNCLDGANFIHYKRDNQNPFSLSDNRIWEIFEDSQNRLWIGTLRSGLELFDRKANKFISFKPPFGSSYFITSIIEDKKSNIWVGGMSGIDVRNKNTKMIKHFAHNENDTNSLSHNNVLDILEDSEGLIWIGTRDGLNLYDPSKKTFKTYRIKDGLPDDNILRIIEDHDANLWLSTHNGLCNVIITRHKNNILAIQFKNYNETDGLQGRQFNDDAALITKAGELVFGGANGFNIFLPQKIRTNKLLPNLILTDLQIFNNSIIVGRPYDGKIILPESISTTKEITLKYNQNVFTIEFAALGVVNTDKVKYAYQLQGFNKQWLTTDVKNRKATFTNLNPGTYTLLIKACNESGIWMSQPLALTICVLPPFWLTNWAFFFYVVLLIGFLLYSRNRIIHRTKLKISIEQEKVEAQRLHELNLMKIRFFTNLSHEFRTPLSLIIAPIEKLMKQTSLIQEHNKFQLIYRNARRLLNMVNQLLDFSKLEENELHLNKTMSDIVLFTKDIFYSFSDIAESKNIEFSFQTTINTLLIGFDHDKLERILFNLLFNAFKFTPEGGKIIASMQLGLIGENEAIEIKITDNGIGIDKDKQQKIFERFFQNDQPTAIANQGNGLGLSISKEFVQLHGGTIHVESEINKGSSFIILLPIKQLAQENYFEERKTSAELAETELISAAQKKEMVVSSRKKLLFVEDNDDFRFYIKNNLKNYYTIIEASNGKIGWQKALAEHPDLIISDIDMPEMNGIELCQKIKNDKRTSFIPVILLTGLPNEETQLMGLKIGANDYIMKPFNFEILLSKIRNLYAQQDSFKKTYQKQVQVQPSKVVLESVDDIFVQRALVIVEKNIADPDFSVNEMSRELMVSRAALYKRLFNLTGQTPSEFIRSIRLQRAIQLLESGQMRVGEVAYEVGFSDPKHFSKIFKATYHALPSAYLKNKNNNTP